MNVNIRTQINVVESIGSIPCQDHRFQDDGENMFSVFSVIVRDHTGSRTLLRYLPDFVELQCKFKETYGDVKIPFPHFVTFSVSRQTQTGIRRMLHALSQFTAKSNAEKAEYYLQRCLLDGVIGRSSILRDFLSPQREEDVFTPTTANSPVPEPQSPLPIDVDSSEEEAVVPEDALFEDISSFSLGSRELSSNYSHVDSTENDALDISVTDEHHGVFDNMSFSHMSTISDISQQIEELGKSVIDEYDLLKVLGKGCMGKVLLVRHTRKKQTFALKAIAKETVLSLREIAHTHSERDILVELAMFSHPFLIKLHHAFQDPLYLFLVLDYHNGGDIANQMSLRGVFSPERTLFYAAEIVEGLGELHRRGIMYRDLKPENILLSSSGHVVLTDFGLSKSFTLDELASQPMSATFCGTAEYLAPEMLLNEPHSFTVDYWSLGTILYEMLVGCTPFYAQTTSLMYHRILEDELVVPEYLDMDTEDFLSGLLTKDQFFRLGSCGIEEIKMHPYFKNVGWSDVVELKMDPPFVPANDLNNDLFNVDEVFLKMTPRLSTCAGIEEELRPEFDELFRDYDYISPIESPALDANVPEQPNKPVILRTPTESLCSREGQSGTIDSASVTSFLRKSGGKKRSSVDMLSDSSYDSNSPPLDPTYHNEHRPSKRHHSESFDTACSMDVEEDSSATDVTTDTKVEPHSMQTSTHCHVPALSSETKYNNAPLPKVSGFKTVFTRHLKGYSIFYRAKHFFAHFHRG
ncbi:kinase-like domain-containing protein [Umbelopsis sp. AD052]|nr:kinase-like domain-containing protein [Umbelopsis sp. AD052]